MGGNYYGGAFVDYGTLRLTETSPVQSFDEPFTVAEIKTFLNLNNFDLAEDDLLTQFIVAAREQAEIYQGRDLVQKQFDLAYDYWPTYRIPLRAPLVSVDLVRYRDSSGDYTTLVEDTNYIVDSSRSPGIISPPSGDSWPSFDPWPSSALLIRYTAGLASTDAWWADSGARIKIGMKMLISHWYGPGRMAFSETGAISEFPFTITHLLSQGSIPRVR